MLAATISRNSRLVRIALPHAIAFGTLSWLGSFSCSCARDSISRIHRDGTAEGGHVVEAIVSPTLEVFVTVDLVPLHQRYDPASDLTLINPVIQ